MSTSIHANARHPSRCAAGAPLFATLSATLFAALLASSGCTSLGPMPGMTVANAVPDPRTGAEVNFAAVPAAMLSDGARADVDEFSPAPQLSAWFEPGELIDRGQGIGIGLRYLGAGGDFFEPMFRYRAWTDDNKQVAVMGVLYGTTATGEERRAQYKMSRLGAEFDVDVRVTPISRWIELHFSGGGSVTGVWADGKYCMNEETGYGRDCDMDKDDRPNAEVSIKTAVPAVHVGMHVDLLRDIPVIHGVRIGVMVAAGLQPTFQNAEVGHWMPWFSTGFQGSVGFGGPKP